MKRSNFVRALQKSLSLVLCVTLISLYSAKSGAKEAGDKIELTNDMLVSLLPQTLDQAKWLLASADVDTDDAKSITDSLEKSALPKNKPLFAMKDKEIFVSGEPTGIRVTSLKPFNLSYKGQTWVPSARKTTSQNYFELKRFLSTGQLASRASIFLPAAFADQSPLLHAVGTAAVDGIVVAGLLALGVVVVTAGAGIGGWACVVYGIGMGAGEIYGAIQGWRAAKAHNAALVKLNQLALASHFSCSLDAVTMSVPGPDGDFATVKVNKDLVSQPVSMSDDNGHPLDMTRMDQKTLALIKKIAPLCKNEADAKKLNANWSRAVTRLFSTPGQPVKTGSPGGSSS